MLALEQNPGAPGVLDDMFRAIHTIKGSSGFFDFLVVGRISHAGENLMSALREGRVFADAEGVSTLLEMSDVLRRLLNGAMIDGHEPAYDEGDLVERLQRLLEGGSPAPAVAAPVAHVPSASPTPARASNPPLPAAAEHTDRTLRVDVEVIDRLMD